MNEPSECPKCGCDSVACTCGYIDELRGVVEQEEDYEPEPDEPPDPEREDETPPHIERAIASEGGQGG